MDPTLLTSAAYWAAPADVPFATSGSSGAPKQVVISKAALLTSAGAVNTHLGVTADACWGLALPPNHVGGFGVAARAYAAGCRLVHFGKRWDARLFQGWLVQDRVSHTSLVPTQVHDLVAAGLACPASLVAIVVGGGQLDAATGQAARALGWPVLASYGMTEAASQVATQSPAALWDIYQPAPIPLLPIWQARTAADGLLQISGPALFAGYVSEGKFAPRAGEWHLTSDRVLLEGRNLIPLGRADSLVKILGELVDPEAIERELVALSGGGIALGSFAVVPIPDERAGFILIPFFPISADLPAIERTLAVYHSQALGFRRLGRPVMLENFPRGDLGKPRRAQLAAQFPRP